MWTLQTHESARILLLFLQSICKHGTLPVERLPRVRRDCGNFAIAVAALPRKQGTRAVKGGVDRSSTPNGRHLWPAPCVDAPRPAMNSATRASSRRGTESLRTCMGVFLSSGCLVCYRFLVWSGKAVPRPVACDQVRGARGKVSRDRNASVA